MVQLNAKYQKMIRDIITSTPNTDAYKFIIFGSRAAGTARRYSDVDIGILSDEPVPLSILGDLEERFENSYLPYKIDVVDLNRTVPAFRRLALKHTELL